MSASGPADPVTIRARVAEVRQRLAAAGDREGRVRVIAVTKGFPVEVAAAALAAGLSDLGENYGQELVAKAAELRPVSGPDVRWHFIGALQRNKVKLLAGAVDLWQTVDRPELAEAITRRAPGASILVQVNTTAERQKAGCQPADAPGLIDRARELGLDVQGLMTLGPTAPDQDPRPCFARLRELAGVCGVRELSMGMSGDFEVAVEEGSTMIRIGTALFGDRPARG